MRAFHRGVRGLEATTTPLRAEPLVVDGALTPGWVLQAIGDGGAPVVAFEGEGVALTGSAGGTAVLSFALPPLAADD